MIIKESAENYLESILVIKNQKGFVRSIDIANDLEVSKPSVSVAMKNFREEGYITVDPDGNIDLTEKGLNIAKRVLERHEVISKALMALGVSEKTALEDSCKIEHVISEETFSSIKEFLKSKNIEF
ncbi:MAG: metal-dependent transcriptional regulator [Clostridia bacterium]|nr:metal-dependent transcriptional regulator [Clostridia bacterium]